MPHFISKIQSLVCVKTRLALTLIAVAVVGTAGITLFAFNSAPNSMLFADYGPKDNSFLSTAHAGASLDQMSVAKTMRVRVTETGTANELVIGSFSRIGFISGSNDFLLESLPSEDKKPFYKLVQKSLKEINNPVMSNPTRLDIAIDIFSGDYDLIQTLSYKKCSVFDYFVHSVDSRGKIPFLEDGTQEIEFREVTKFTCQSFDLIIED